ncbi:group II intron maturase-specific domain-containing protein [Kitasatospora misakiensis]|uniref:Group II intron maturase-specific domain-containing protein n=1 Tax=Kitasatospora misakiensis TaxID=67330 RepID=A0ABW0XDF6_9ACTN
MQGLMDGARLHSVLRGWCAYFRSGVSNVTVCYLTHYAWMRVVRWIRREHPGIAWKQLRRHFCGGGWWPSMERRELFNPAKVSMTRYRYRGTTIPSPWPTAVRGSERPRTGLVESLVPGDGHAGFGRRLGHPAGGDTSRVPRVDLADGARVLRFVDGLRDGVALLVSLSACVCGCGARWCAPGVRGWVGGAGWVCAPVCAWWWGCRCWLRGGGLCGSMRFCSKGVDRLDE